MGASEKHDATYHGGEYTMELGRVRHAATEPYGERITGAEFDRWLEAVRAEAKAEALREVASDLENASVSPIWCWDKCGDPKCRDDIRVDTATEIQSWIRVRADKHVEGLS